jgi:hypothetical protein
LDYQEIKVSNMSPRLQQNKQKHFDEVPLQTKQHTFVPQTFIDTVLSNKDFLRVKLLNLCHIRRRYRSALTHLHLDGKEADKYFELDHSHIQSFHLIDRTF